MSSKGAFTWVNPGVRVSVNGILISQPPIGGTSGSSVTNGGPASVFPISASQQALSASPILIRLLILSDECFSLTEAEESARRLSTAQEETNATTTRFPSAIPADWTFCRENRWETPNWFVLTEDSENERSGHCFYLHDKITKATKTEFFRPALGRGKAPTRAAGGSRQKGSIIFAINRVPFFKLTRMLVGLMSRCTRFRSWVATKPAPDLVGIGDEPEA